jgi:hypothetical protein
MNNHFELYCKESSIHGFPYIVNRKLHFIEKILWICALIASFVCSGVLIFQIGVKFQDDELVTYTSDTAIDVTDVSSLRFLKKKSNFLITQIPFAAVTFCPDLLNYNDEFDYNQTMTALKQNEITIENVTEKEFVNNLCINFTKH